MIAGKKRLDVDKAVQECRTIADHYLKNWKPSNPEWKNIEGCAYLRLSTDDQVLVEKGSLEQQVYMAIQEAELRSRQKRKNYKITQFFIEPGVSGRKSDRREFIELKRAIRRGDYSFVAFKELSRIARDSQIWKDFFRLCQSKDCEIVIRGLPIDPNDPSQILQLDILAVFAEYEAQVTAKRIRESVFSAMLNSGKFNSTHKTLGLDPLVVSGQRKVGFYQVNEEEIKTVKWIMETFVKYGSHQKTLEACNEKGIKNWNGLPLHRHSLITLLSNPKYIGKWFLNEANKDSDQEDLAEQKKFYEIDLPHGAVVPPELWDKVQATLKHVAGNLGKNTRVSRVYPLSGGILRFRDGSTFRGCSGTGKTKRSHYYFNEENGLRIKCELFEEDVKKVVTKIIENSPELQDAIRDAGEETSDNIQFLNQRLKDIKRSIERVEQQKKNCFQKLELLTAGSSEEDVQVFKSEFKGVLQTCAKEKQELEDQLRKTEQELAEIEASSFSWKEIPQHASRVQDLMLDKDPVALKRAYRGLFSAIIVGDEDEMGNRILTYVLKNSDELPTDFSADGVRLSSKLVETVGIEPTSERHPSLRSSHAWPIV